MTSLDETLDTILAAALRELTKFARSPISDATFLQGYEYMLHYQSMLKQDDVFIDVLIDYSKTVNEFKKLGVLNFQELYSQKKQSIVFDDFEKGNIQSEKFISSINIAKNLKIKEYLFIK